jgi:hypothetical protein
MSAEGEGAESALPWAKLQLRKKLKATTQANSQTTS